MLKITVIDSEHKRTLVLEGKLREPWISELERSWTEAQGAKGARKIVVDLKDVTAISQVGENLLFQMMADGAMFNCCRGVLTKHVLQQLERRREAQRERSRTNCE
jgi:ABC-type transporter Mla MlaB component